MVDALCLDDLDRFGRELDDPLEELAQDIFHRLIEAPGTNPDDPDRGLGIFRMLSGVVDDSWGARIEAECRKDDRVTAATATIVLVSGGGNAGGSYEITLDLEPEGSLSIVLDDSGARRAA